MWASACYTVLSRNRIQTWSSVFFQPSGPSLAFCLPFPISGRFYKRPQTATSYRWSVQTHKPVRSTPKAQHSTSCWYRFIVAVLSFNASWSTFKSSVLSDTQDNLTVNPYKTTIKFQNTSHTQWYRINIPILKGREEKREWKNLLEQSKTKTKQGKHKSLGILFLGSETHVSTTHWLHGFSPRPGPLVFIISSETILCICHLQYLGVFILTLTSPFQICTSASQSFLQDAPCHTLAVSNSFLKC